VRCFSRLMLIVVLAMGVAIPGRADADTAVTVCGQEVHGNGFLAADLDCTGFSGYAAIIVGGTFSLGGFTLSGGDFGSVSCPGSCKVVGPGTITGSPFAGIVAFGSLKTSDIDLTNHTAYGLECFKACKLTGGTISGNGDGLRGGAGAVIKGVTISGNTGYGVRMQNNARRAKAKILNSSITDNGDEGVFADRSVSVRDSAITGNGTFGATAGSSDCSTNGVVKLKNADVTGNGIDPACGVSERCADVASCRLPRVIGSTCGTSYMQNSGFPGDDWNVCTLD
jgi:hypothetical protein